MERLTAKSKDGYHYPHCFREDTCGGEGYSSKCDKCEFAYKVCEKLGRLEDLQEQGRLLELPCAVRDTVYRINKGAEQPIIPLQVLNFKIFNNDLVESFKMECADEWDGGYTYKKTDIGRDVFLTSKEAEEALKRMEDVK